MPYTKRPRLHKSFKNFPILGVPRHHAWGLWEQGVAEAALAAEATLAAEAALVDAADPVVVLVVLVDIAGRPGEEGSRQHQLEVGVHQRQLEVGILPGRRTGLETDDPLHLVAAEDKERPVLAALEGLLASPVAADFRIDVTVAVVAAVPGSLVVRDTLVVGLQDNLVAEDERLDPVEEYTARTWNSHQFLLSWRRG